MLMMPAFHKFPLHLSFFVALGIQFQFISEHGNISDTEEIISHPYTFILYLFFL